MTLDIASTRCISEIQGDFNRQYSYLKIEFYAGSSNSVPPAQRKHLQNSVLVKKAGLTRNGTIEISDYMTVGELENIFRTEFGLFAQVSRKSGILWLETTMTDKWTLKQQNDHGKELSEPVVYTNKYTDRLADET